MGLLLPPLLPIASCCLANLLIFWYTNPSSPLLLRPLLFSSISSVEAVFYFILVFGVFLIPQKINPHSNVSVAKQKTQVSGLVSPGPHTSTEIQRNRKKNGCLFGL